MQEAQEGAGGRRYSTFDRKGQGRGLLVTAMDVERSEQAGQQPLTAKERRFLAPTSMRDVEPSVHIYVDRKPPSEGGEGTEGEA